MLLGSGIAVFLWTRAQYPRPLLGCLAIACGAFRLVFGVVSVTWRLNR